MLPSSVHPFHLPGANQAHRASRLCTADEKTFDRGIQVTAADHGPEDQSWPPSASESYCSESTLSPAKGTYTGTKISFQFLQTLTVVQIRQIAMM